MYYKEQDGQLLSGNTIENKDYELTKENKDTIELPLDGWVWIEHEDDDEELLMANTFFNIVDLSEALHKPPEPEEPPEQNEEELL